MELKENETEAWSINGPIHTKPQHTNLCTFRFIPSLPDGQNDWPKHVAVWNKSERAKVTVLFSCVDCTADEVSFSRRPDTHCSGNKQTHYFQRASKHSHPTQSNTWTATWTFQSPNKLVSLPRRSSLALSKTATPIVHSILSIGWLYAARWIPQHFVVAVNVPPSWHLGFPFFQLWTMAKLTYNLLRLL